jgi:two-component system chemotaxis response regulator CheY
MPDRLTKLSVLVADSSSHMASLVGQMLRALKVRDIVEVTSAGRLISTLANRKFDLVLIEIDLDAIDALEIIRKLRAAGDNPNHAVPIIMMATAAAADRVAAARDAGITEFLRKPFAPSYLETRIRAALAQPREFVDAGAYAGPDRRRRKTGASSPRRRAQDAAAE